MQDNNLLLRRRLASVQHSRSVAGLFPLQKEGVEKFLRP